MILIDSSAWIEYYKPMGDTQIKKAVYTAIQNDEAAINGIILVEIAGFVREKERSLILTDPPTDAIIAACALESNASLLHRDTHFTEIERHFPLTVHPARP